MYHRMMRRWLAPTARAASTYWFSLADMAALRIMRELLAAERTPSDGMTFSSPGPSMAMTLSNTTREEGHPGIDQALHQHVKLAPEIAAADADGSGQRSANADGAKAHCHRDLGPVDNAAKGHARGYQSPGKTALGGFKR